MKQTKSKWTTQIKKEWIVFSSRRNACKLCALIKDLIKQIKLCKQLKKIIDFVSRVCRESKHDSCVIRSVSHLWTGEGNAADDARSGESSLGKDQSYSWIISGKQKETLTRHAVWRRTKPINQSLCKINHLGQELISPIQQL